MRKIRSSRGSLFYLCQLSQTDKSFPKYPRLPVWQCAGYEKELKSSDRCARSTMTKRGEAAD
jgi:hypothetical protein